MNDNLARPRIPSEKIKQRLTESIAQQRALKANLITDLSALKSVVSSAANIDLRDGQGAITEAVMAMQKAAGIIEQVQGRLNAGACHLSESVKGLDVDPSWHELLNHLTVVMYEDIYFSSHRDTIKAVLLMVDPDVFRAAFAELPVERQSELVFCQQ